jgi:hypothetical protein
VKLRNLVQTCDACPSQWEAETTDGQRVYVRYRWGHLRVELDGQSVYEADHGDPLDGDMTTERMLELTGMTMNTLGKPSIIAITGPKESGKSTVGKYLHETYGYSRIRFADPLKAMLAAYGLTEHELEGDGKQLPCALLGGHTPRHAMQSLGTGWGRNLMSQTFWTDAWSRRVGHGLGGYVVAEDLRFCNEEFTVRLHGGVIWRIERPGLQGTDEHESEREHMLVRYDRLFHNDGSVEDLLRKVRKEIEE